MPRSLSTVDKRILFDTGNNGDILAQNAKAKASTCPSSISSSCLIGTAITWVAWRIC